MKLRAMVVDDSRVMRLMIMKALRQTHLAEWEFSEAEDGAVALERISSARPDILFADWNMPRLTGIELMEELRKQPQWKDLPLVMVTSEKGMPKLLEAADAAGANAYVCKPFTVEELTQKLEGIVKGIERSKASSGFFSRLFGGR